jgi:hypothetical protein
MVTRQALIALVLVLVAPAGRPSGTAWAETLTFPPSVVTTQDKLDWLTVQADRAAQAVDAEAQRPLAEQREAVYRATLERAEALMRLVNSADGRLPRLEGRLSEILTHATAGVERIVNARLAIGMTTDQVREIRGEPSRISDLPTASGLRQRWQYGATVLLFDRGKLVEIRQMLNAR